MTAYNDRIMSDLSSYKGNLNERLFKYLGDLSYLQDTLPERMEACGYNMNPQDTFKRHFLHFTGVQYGELQSLPITENADFEIEISFSGLSEGSNTNPSILLSIIEASSNGKNIHIGRRDGNTFTFAFFGSDLNVDLTGLIDWSEINTIICKYTHADARKTIFLNGVEVASAIQSPLAIDWSGNPLTLLARRRLDTVVASFQIDRIRVWWGGDRTTGTPVPGLGDIRIDDPNSIYQRDYSADQSGGFVGIELKDTIIPGDFEQYERLPGWRYWVNEFWPQLLSYSVDFSRWGPLGCSSSYDGSVSVLTVTDASNPYVEINTEDTSKYNTAEYSFSVDVTAPAGRTISVGLLRDGYSDFDFEYVVATGNRQTIKIDRIFNQIPGSVRCRFSMANSEQNGQVGDEYVVHSSSLRLSSELETHIKTSGTGGDKITYAEGAGS